MKKLKNGKIKLIYNDKIPNKDALLQQLVSLRHEARLMMPQDPIFGKDFQAISMALMVVEEVVVDEGV